MKKTRQLKALQSTKMLWVMIMLMSILLILPFASAWSTTTFNNSLGSENITLIGNQSNFRYLAVPANTNFLTLGEITIINYATNPYIFYRGDMSGAVVFDAVGLHNATLTYGLDQVGGKLGDAIYFRAQNNFNFTFNKTLADFSIAFWYRLNQTSGDPMFFTAGDGADQLQYMTTTQKIIWQVQSNSYAANVNNSLDGNTSWYLLVATQNNTDRCVYLHGGTFQKDCKGITGGGKSIRNYNPGWLGSYNNISNRLNGTIDDFGIFSNFTMTSNDVLNYYNSSNGTPFTSTRATLGIGNNNSITSLISNVTLIAGASHWDIQKRTIDVKNYVSSYLAGCTYISNYCYVPFNFTSDYSGIVGYLDLDFSGGGFVTNSISYNLSTYETKRETFILNISYDKTNLNLDSAALIYNGTSYISTIIESGDNTFLTSIVDVLPITSSQQNNSFYWDIIISNSSSSGHYYSATYNQTILSLVGVIVSPTCTDKAYKFDLIDEVNFTSLLSNVQYNIQYGLNNNSQKSIVGSLSDVYNFSLCINSSISQNWTIGSAEIQYSKEGYAARRYYIFNNRIINNQTTYVNLSLLLSSLQTSFQLSIKDAFLTPYVDYYTATLRWYPAFDEYRIVEMGKTDTSGTTVLHVATEDVDYRIALYELNGTLVQLDNPTRMLCLVNPCSYSMKVETEETDFTSYFGLDYTFTFNETTGIWTFIYSDSSQRTDLMNLTVYKKNNLDWVAVCSDSSSNFIGVLVCNTSAYTSGEFKANVFRQASPLQLVTQKFWNLFGTAFRTKTVLWIVTLISLPLIFVFAMVSPIFAVIGTIISLIPLYYFNIIDTTIFGGLLVIGVIIIIVTGRLLK